MHACELLDVATLVTTHAPHLLASARRLSEAGLLDYWEASKCQLDRWGGKLRASPRRAGKRAAREEELRTLLPIAQEVLAGEVLTRIWNAVTRAHDALYRQQEAEPLTRSVLLGHLEARHRVLKLVSESGFTGSPQDDQLNRLRTRCERWTDVMLAYLSVLHACEDLAFDRARMRDFAESFGRGRRHAIADASWGLTAGSLRSSFRSYFAGPSPNAELNARIARSILACFPSDTLDATGIASSLWTARLTQNMRDMQRMLVEVIGTEPLHGAGH